MIKLFILIFSILGLKYVEATMTKKCAFIITQENPKEIKLSSMPMETQNYIDALQSKGWVIDLFYDEKLAKKNATKLDRIGKVKMKTTDPNELKLGLSSLENENCSQVLFISIAHGSCGLNHGFIFPNGSFPVASMVKSIRRLKKRGAKVAMIDQTCYSANSIDILKDELDCVMGTSGRYYSTSEFSTQSLAQILNVSLRGRVSELSSDLKTLKSDESLTLEKDKGDSENDISEEFSLQDLFMRYVCSDLNSPSPDISSLQIYKSYQRSCTTDWGKPISNKHKKIISTVLTPEINKAQIERLLKYFWCNNLDFNKMKEAFNDFSLMDEDEDLMLTKSESGAISLYYHFYKLIEQDPYMMRCMEFQF